MTPKSLPVPLVNLIRQNQTPKTTLSPFRSALHFFFWRQGVSSLVGPIATSGAMMWAWMVAWAGWKRVNEEEKTNMSGIAKMPPGVTIITVSHTVF